ncbi:MAG TPA: adenylate/guanylate cyclase domain-containing protein [Dongiaceae bacterium]|nr:adenylate/guanylate cyclase domain-containing protein [Dongiaceae bacterium]
MPSSLRGLERLRQLTGGGRLLGLALLVGLLALRAWDPGPVVAMRFKFFDVFQQWLPRQETGYPVVIVDIDEKSLAELGQWPWPRSVLASLVNRLRADGAAAIGFDVIFSEPDRNLSVDTARLLSLPAADLRQALTNLQTNDIIFADSLSGGRVVLGQLGLSPEERAPAPVRDAQTTPALIGGDPRPYLYSYAALLENIPPLAAAAAGRGSFSLVPEVDGIVRRVPLVTRVGDSIVPSLDAEVLRVATGQKNYAIRLERQWGGVTAGIAAVVVAGVAITTDRHGMVYLRYGPHERARFVSASDAIAGRVDPKRFAGHIVLVGTSAAGLRDLRQTPLDVAMPGVEVHAQLLESILAGTYLTLPSYAQGLELVITAFGGLMLILLVPMVGPRWTLTLHSVATAGLIAGSLFAFKELSFLFDWSFPTLSGTAVYLLLVYVKYTVEERQRRRITGIFGQYLSPVLVEQLARQPPQLGGELRNMTVMFADLRNFTTISERLRNDPQGLTALINRFLTPMTMAVLAESGTVDKYIGDSLMAFWNAPLDIERHGAHACAAALAMAAGLDRLNDELRGEAEPASVGAAAPPVSLGMGIGINTGECVVGNMGSTHRFNYSVMGDSVNIASRLESLTKLYGTGILISESTYAEAKEFAALEVDLVAVKGRREAVHVFALLGGPELAATPDFQALVEGQQRLLAAYRAQRWAEARQLIEAIEPGNERLSRLYRLYRYRLDAFERQPPDAGWNGVFTAETK